MTRISKNCFCNAAVRIGSILVVVVLSQLLGGDLAKVSAILRLASSLTI